MWALSDISQFNQQLILLAVVLCLKVVLQRFIPHHPWRSFQFYCTKLADKVNKAENSINQQKVAGFVATLITFIPLWVIVWLFESLVAVPLLWQSLLLYFALGSGDIFVKTTQVAKAITAKDNYQAKQVLAPYVLRDTDQMSALGLNKAAIEMQTLKHLQLYIVPGALCLLTSPLIAFSYRLLLEMHYSWNIKHYRFNHFGLFSRSIIQTIQWLPIRITLLFALLLTLGSNFLLYWRLTTAHFFKSNNDAVLAFFAPVHNIKLGGVSMYNGIKLRRASFNDNGRQPEASDVIHVQKFFWRLYLLIAVMLAAVATVSQLIIR